MHRPMHPPIRQLIALFILISLLISLLSACAPNAAPPVASANVVQAMSAASTEGYARATAPRPFTFPADHGPHPTTPRNGGTTRATSPDRTGPNMAINSPFFVAPSLLF